MRKLFFNVGFQFNYGEPFALRSFYNATYFQNIFSSRDFKNVTTEDSISGNATNKYDDGGGRVESRSIDGSNGLVGKDVSAAELYESIEDNFVEYVLLNFNFK